MGHDIDQIITYPDPPRQCPKCKVVTHFESIKKAKRGESVTLVCPMCNNEWVSKKYSRKLIQE